MILNGGKFLTASNNETFVDSCIVKNTRFVPKQY